ncbi:MAG: HAMP domain-containing histidine kinase, partial [Oscillospiraceae bacterium]|nr:HAMP domain-containing histidine kinase [Oscillospiraceae bacterium]
VIAFLLALAFGVALCGGMGGLAYAMSYYSGRYETSYESSEGYYWNMHYQTELLQEYLFLSQHNGNLTTAGQERLSELLQMLKQGSTNFRFVVYDEQSEVVAYNTQAEEQDEAETWECYSFTNYQIAKDRNVAYYLDLAKTKDWSVRVGADSDWASNDYVSNYYYTLRDYVLMLQEAAEGTGQETWGGTENEGAAYEESEPMPVEATDEETGEVYEPMTQVSDAPAGEEGAKEGAFFYDEYTGQYYVSINGQYYNYNNEEQYVYYQFDPKQEQDYMIYYWLDPDLPVEDEFSQGAEAFERGQAIYQQYFGPSLAFCAAMLLLFLAALAVLTWTVGWNQAGELALRGMNKLSVEGVCVWLVCGVCGAVGAIWLAEQFYTGDYGYDQYCLFFGAAGVVAVPVCLTGWMTLIAQLKTKMLLKRSLCWRVWMKFWNWCKKIWQNSADWLKQLVEGRALYQKLMIYFLIYLVPYMLWMMGIAVHVWSGGSGLGGCLIAFVFPLLPVLAFACKWAMDWNRMRQQVKKLIEGDFEFKLDTAKMLPDVRAHGEDLNNLSAGLSKAVEERVKSQRFKTELITNVSHDLKTPLTSIINYVDLLKKANIEDETARGYIEVLDRKSQRLKNLTEDLVEASKAASGTIGVHLEALDVVELVEQAVGEYDERLKQADLTVLIKKPETPFQVMADGRHLWRILDNLLGNCTKYAMPGTRVYLDVSKKGKTAVIELKNISADPLNVPEEELMKRFVRGDSARSTEGSGLGLSIARNLTIAQKGEFQLVVDGDLFKAVIQLPTAE